MSNRVGIGPRVGGTVRHTGPGRCLRKRPRRTGILTHIINHVSEIVHCGVSRTHRYTITGRGIGEEEGLPGAVGHAGTGGAVSVLAG